MKTQVFSELKKRTIDLRNNCFNTRQHINDEEVEYQLYNKNNLFKKIIIENGFITFVSNNGIESKQYLDFDSLKSMLHNYIRKSILNGSICSRYLVYKNYNGEHRNIMAFNNERYLVNNDVGIIMCDNEISEQIIKDEFISIFGFVPSLHFGKPCVRVLQ